MCRSAPKSISVEAVPCITVYVTSTFDLIKTSSSVYVDTSYITACFFILKSIKSMSYNICHIYNKKKRKAAENDGSGYCNVRRGPAACTKMAAV